MGSPITFSNFNSIDFNVILTSVMQQESQPLFALQNQQSALSTQKNAYAALGTRLSALESAASSLSTTGDVAGFRTTVSDSTALVASTSSSASPGRYEVVVNELARSQVTASATTAPDPTTTIVAGGGTLTIGGVAVAISGPVTLQGLADQINATANIPATASLVQSAPGAFKLVLTGTQTGESHAFTIVNALTGGTGVGFTDTDNNGITGDSTQDNAIQATDASVLINNIAVKSASNTLTSGIPGTTLSLLQKDPAKTIVVSVAEDDAALTDKVKSFVSSFNDLIKFSQAQTAAERSGQQGTLGHDALLRQLRDMLRTAIGATYGSGSPNHLADVGIGFDRSGGITLDEAKLSEALTTGRSNVTALFTTSGGGSFAAIKQVVHSYTQAGGFLSSAQQRLQDQMSRLDTHIAAMQDRLAIRRAALQREYTAADQLMSQLKAQSGSLSSVGSGGLSTNG